MIKDIIKRNCRPSCEDNQIRVVVYYTNPKTRSLVMKNNLFCQTETISKANVVYEYQCTFGDCAPRNNTYIGHTRCSLSRRLTMHQQEGAIKQHLRHHHNLGVNRENLISSTKIIASSGDPRRLHLLEAMYIIEKVPTINIQSNMTSSIELFNFSLRRACSNIGRSPPPSSSPPLPPPPASLRRSARIQARDAS